MKEKQCPSVPSCRWDGGANMHLLEIDPGHRWEARFRGDLICVSPPSRVEGGTEERRDGGWRNYCLRCGLKNDKIKTNSGDCRKRLTSQSHSSEGRRGAKGVRESIIKTRYGYPPPRLLQIRILNECRPKKVCGKQNHTSEGWYPFPKYAPTRNRPRTPLGSAVPG